MSSSIDSADLYFQLSREESWALEDGIVKEGSASIEQGVGVRAVAGEKTGLCLLRRNHIAGARRGFARGARHRDPRRASVPLHGVVPTHGHNLYLPIDPVSSFTSSEKVAWLERIDRETRKMDPRVKQVMASVVAVHEVVLVANSEGHLAADVRPLVRINVSVIVEQDGRREQGYAGAGGRITLPELVADDKPIALAREAVRQALVNLDAVPAPAGLMTVVLGPGWPGILLHEAIGHGLEGDFNRKGTSAFAGRVGERVASEVCTVVDDGTLLAPPRFAQYRRRRHAHAVHDAHRKRGAQGLSAGHHERAAHGHEIHGQWPARILRAHHSAAHDQYLHAGRQDQRRKKSWRQCRRASTP